MTTQEVAKRLYDLCEQHDSNTAHKELYSPDVTSTEGNMQGQRETIKGMEAIKEKNKQNQPNSSHEPNAAINHDKQQQSSQQHDLQPYFISQRPQWIAHHGIRNIVKNIMLTRNMLDSGKDEIKDYRE